MTPLPSEITADPQSRGPEVEKPAILRIGGTDPEEDGTSYHRRRVGSMVIHGRGTRGLRFPQQQEEEEEEESL